MREAIVLYLCRVTLPLVAASFSLGLEADVFWATAAIGIEELTAWLSVYQLSRDMVPRGIIEVIWDD